MLRSQLRRAVLRPLAKPAFAPLPMVATPVRNFASEKQLRMRIAGVNVIKKITKAMKMVAAARVKKSQDALEHARRFSVAMEAVWPEPDAAKTESKEARVGNYGIIAVTADRGLAGAVNNSIVRDVKGRLNADPDYRPSLITIGEKGRAGLDRLWAPLFQAAITDQMKLKRSSFRNCMEIADVLQNQPLDSGYFLFNKFKNMLSYYAVTLPYQSPKRALESTTLGNDYELEGPDDLLENLYSFRLATRVFLIMAEQETCELSSRMAAMGNSAKNASDVIDRLTLKCNRQRQARITTELCEIIGGMESMKG